MTTQIVLPWPLRSGLEAATRGLFGLGDQSSGDFLRPRWRSPVGSMIIANAMNVSARGLGLCRQS